MSATYEIRNMGDDSLVQTLNIKENHSELSAESSPEQDLARRTNEESLDTASATPARAILRPIGSTGGTESTGSAMNKNADAHLAVSNDIIYHTGGAVMTGQTTLYNIFFGSLSTTTINQINYLSSNLGGSAWYNIQNSYYDGSGNRVPNNIKSYSVYVTNSAGFTATDAVIQSKISALITAGTLPRDVNGIYMVYFGSGVSLSGMCTSFCGYHTYFSNSGVYLKYALVGDGSLCGGSCGSFSSGPPNGDLASDLMASVAAHEIVEVVSDPLLNAWYDASGWENADKCAWNFGSYLSGYSNANVMIGTKPFLLQQNWVVGSGCALKYSSEATSRPTIRSTITTRSPTVQSSPVIRPTTAPTVQSSPTIKPTAVPFVTAVPTAAPTAASKLGSGCQCVYSTSAGYIPGVGYYCSSNSCYVCPLWYYCPDGTYALHYSLYNPSCTRSSPSSNLIKGEDNKVPMFKTASASLPIGEGNKVPMNPPLSSAAVVVISESLSGNMGISSASSPLSLLSSASMPRGSAAIGSIALVILATMALVGWAIFGRKIKTSSQALEAASENASYGDI